jgi:hypothetical protein
MDRDDRVGAVGLAAEHLLGLGGLDFSLEIVEAARQVGPDVLAGARPFDQDAEVVGAALELLSSHAKRGELGDDVHLAEEAGVPGLAGDAARFVGHRSGRRASGR